MKRILLIGLAPQAVRNAKRKSHVRLWFWVLSIEVITEATDLDSIAKGGGAQTEEEVPKVRCLEIVLFTCCLSGPHPPYSVRLQTTFPRFVPAGFLSNSASERHRCYWKEFR